MKITLSAASAEAVVAIMMPAAATYRVSIERII
jgi:hypothetical protein